MAGNTDLIGALREYAQKTLGSDFSPEKAAASLNAWMKEGGGALKERIERETERTVKKLGLAKASDIKKLQDQLSELRRALGIKATSAPRRAKKSTAKKSTAKKSTAKKSTAKKSTAK